MIFPPLSAFCGKWGKMEVFNLISYFIDAFSYLLSSGLVDGFLSFSAVAAVVLIVRDLFAGGEIN